MKILKQLFWFGLLFYIFVGLFIGLVTVNLYSFLKEKISTNKKNNEIKTEYVVDSSSVDIPKKQIIYDTVFVQKPKPKIVENIIKPQTRDSVRDTTKIIIRTNDSTKTL